MWRLILDGVMAALMIALLCFSFLPHAAHEGLGILFALAVGVHIYNNRKWFAHSWKTMKRNRLSFMVNWLLLLMVIATVVSGIIISHYVFKGYVPDALRRVGWLKGLHKDLPYYFLILTGLHAGFHLKGIWNRWMRALHINTKTPSYGRKCHLLGLLIVVGGLYASQINDMAGRLLFEHVIKTDLMEKGGAIFALGIFLTWSMYAVIGYMLAEVSNRRR